MDVLILIANAYSKIKPPNVHYLDKIYIPVWMLMSPVSLWMDFVNLSHQLTLIIYNVNKDLIHLHV
mgnify:CR=1 FL=1